MRIFVSTLFIFLTHFVYGQCLSGTYTIGGVSPNYATIVSAVSALTTNGVCGPVVFNIRSGTYTGQVSISAITGASAINTISFESEAADSTTVSIEATGTSTLNYVVRFNGADFIRFHKVKLKSLGATYSGVVLFTGGADNCEISNCILESPAATTVATTKYQISTATTDNENALFKNNYHTGGCRAINFNGSAAVLTTTRVQNSYFQGQYERALTLINVLNTEVSGNTFITSSTYGSYYAMYLQGCNDNLNIRNNKLDVTAGGALLQLSTCTGGITTPSYLVNNTVNGSGNVGGIVLTNSLRIKVLHNTIMASGTGSCISAPGCDTSVSVQNNIFKQAGTGMVYNLSTTGEFYSNNNAVYSAANYIGNYHGTICNNLFSWQGLAGKDDGSIETLPLLVSSSDLHVATDFSSNQVLPFFAQADTDRDGILRDVTSPYFGAYEFFNTSLVNDAELLYAGVPAANFCSGTYPATVILRNRGSVSLNTVTINWAINGIPQTPFSWSGSLNFNDTVTAVIGSVSFTNLGTYVINANTSMPNGATDEYISNDDASSGTLYTRLAGTYTLGGSSPDFTTFALLQTALYNRGLCGNTYIDVRAGTYTELLNLTPLSNLFNDSLTIRSESGIATSVTIYNPSGVTITLNGAYNVFLKNLTLGLSGAASSTRTIDILTGSQHIGISNCRLAAPTSQNVIYTSLASGLIRDIRILSNTFTSGLNAIALTGTFSARIKDLKVQNNTFDVTGGGAMGVNITYTDTLSYLNNTVQNALSGSSPASFGNTQYADIRSNRFFASNNYALSATSVTNSIVANNMIIHGGTSVSAGFYESNCDYFNFLNNSILTTNTSTATSAMYLNTTGGFCRIWNNSCVNNGGGYVLRSGTSIPISLKTNVYKGTGSIFGYNGLTTASTYANWQILVPADTAGIVINPLYTSGSDLHAHEILLKDSGTPVSSYISDDYDHVLRTGAADIGANEISLYPSDAALNNFSFTSVICNGSNPVQVQLKNNGSSTLTSVDLTYKVNGVTLPVYNWSGSLLPGNQTMVTIGTYTFLPSTAYTLKAWSSNPNGTADLVNMNDTLTSYYGSTGLSGNYTIGGTSPDFATFNTAVTALNTGGVCGPVTFKVRNGTYTEQIRLRNIRGVSSSNFIQFQSESLDSSLVTLAYTSPSSSFNYTVQVDTTDHVRFFKMTIKSLATTYSTAILLSNQAVDFRLNNCAIVGPATGASILLNNNSGSDSIQVGHNVFRYSSEAVNTTGVNSRVTDNSFETQVNTGVTISGLNFNCDRNTFNAMPSQGVYTFGATSYGTISGNKITTTGTSAAIRYQGGNLTNPIIISNNFIIATGGPSILVNGVSGGKILHNTVWQKGNGNCISLTSSTSLTVQNNIFYNSYLSTYCIWYASGNTGYVSDYNDIFSDNNMLVYTTAGPTYTTLSSYNAATGLEGSSVSVTPEFLSSSDLHSNSSSLNNMALYSPLVPTDIDGQARSMTTPDIGADEFVPVLAPNNIQMLALYLTNPGCGTSKFLYAKMRNIGTDTLHTVNFNVNYQGTLYPVFPWSGTIAPAALADSVPIGALPSVFGNGDVTAWTTAPNGLSDFNPANDTALIATANVGMSGIYTIGGTTPDFATIRLATNALKNFGVCGATTFDIRPGTYTDTITIFSIAGSSTYPITFRSATGDSSSVIIQDYTTCPYTESYIIKLSSCRNVKFEKVSFKQNLPTSYSGNNIAVSIKNTGASLMNDIEIKNCSFSSVATDCYGIWHSAGNANNMFITNNRFTSQAIAITTNGAGGSLQISKNIFDQCSTYGLYLSSFTGTVTVSENTFKNDANNIANYALYANSITTFIERNIFELHTGGGMMLMNGTQSVRNNYIHIDSLLTSVYAIFMTNVSATSQFVYNTVRAKEYGTGYLVYITSAGNPEVKNNIISNEGTSGYLWRSDVSTNIDYNRYYTLSPNFGSYNSVFYSTFAAWKAATSNDVHSQFQPVLFDSPTSYSVYADLDLNGAGIPLAGITTDIESDLRDVSTPDIGADEFGSPPLDVQLYSWVGDSTVCNGLQPVSAIIRNTGTTLLTSTIVNWKVNGVSQPAVNFSGTLAPADTAIVLLGNYNFLGGHKYYLRFFTSMPNGVPDVITGNDTLKTGAVKSRLNGIFTVGGASPNFTTFKMAVDSMKATGVCGPVTYNVRAGSYPCNFTVAEIYGASALNTVTFQSEMGDSSLVQFTTNGPGLLLANVKHMYFKKLGFIQNSMLNQYTIGMNGFVRDIEISNCSFNQSLGGSNGTVSADIADSLNGDLRILNSYFGVNTGLKILGYTAYPTPKNLRIENNYMLGYDWVSIDIFENVIFKNNYVVSQAHILGCTGSLDVSSNTLLHALEIEVSGPMPKLVYNNAIIGGQIKVTCPDQISVLHNSVYQTNNTGFGDMAACLDLSGSVVNMHIRNNVFTNAAGRNVFYIDDPTFSPSTIGDIFDYNAIDGLGDTLVFVAGTLFYTSAHWTTLFNQDQHSTFSPRLFAGATDLHLVNDYLANNIGEAAPMVPLDKDGNPRNASHPDPGAYEFNVITVPNDAGIVSYTASFCGSSSSPVTATLRNFGSDTLTSVEIHWTYEGVAQTTYMWAGSLPPDSTTILTVGSFTASFASSNDLMFYTALPNGFVDGNTSTDTLIVNGVGASLSGTYTVGGASADFNTLNDAYLALIDQGMCSSVEFVINPGNYTISSVLTMITGNTPGNKITFRSSSGNYSTVTIDYPGFSSDMMILQDIRELTFKDVSFTGGVEMKNGLDGLTFAGCRFDKSLGTSSSPNRYITTSLQPKNVSVLNCYFNGTLAQHIYYTQYAGATSWPNKLILKGNTFTGTNFPIELSIRVDTVVADSNYFYYTGPLSSNTHAIRVLNPQYYVVSRNYISGDFETGITIGIGSGANDLNSHVSNNVVAGGPNMNWGIYAHADSSSLLYNSVNVIRAGRPAVQLSSRCRLYNNIFRAGTGVAVAMTSFSACYADNNVYYSDGPVLIQKNSINYSTLASFTAAIGVDSNSVNTDPLYVSATNLHYTDTVLNGLAKPLSLIPIDQKGVVRDPVNPNPGAYEMPQDTTYDATNKYIYVSRIVNDTLVIGSNLITASIRNSFPPFTDTTFYRYTGTVDSLRIHYKINDLPEVTETWNGALGFNDSLIYTFATPYVVPNGKLYDIKVWFENLNPLQSEIDYADDSLHKTIIMPMLGVYTIGGLLPDFTSYMKSYLSIYTCNTIGDVTMKYRPGVYSEQIQYEGHTPYNASWIEYTSETGNPDDVSVRLAWLDDERRMKFSKLTITPIADGSYSWGGLMIHNVGSTKFDSCKFVGGSIPLEQGGLCFKSLHDGVTSVITNCTFIGLNYAVHLSTYDNFASSIDTADFVFENNTVINCTNGIMIGEYSNWGDKSVIIKNNKMDVTNDGIHVFNSGSNYLELIGNEIHAGQSALNFNAQSWRTLMVNNMFEGALPNIMDNASSLSMYNNSFDQKLSFTDVSDTLRMYNNVFYTSDTANPAIAIGYQLPFQLVSDNNSYSAPNSPYLIKYGVGPWWSFLTDFTTVTAFRDSTHTDSSSVNFDPLYISATDLHAQSANLKGMARPFSFVTADIDGDSRLIDAPDIGADEIQLMVTDVWPGDADGSGQADNYDLLQIGLFHGQTGSTRSTISNAWTGFPSMDWGIAETNGYDIKHADCNGDGTIDDNDTLAINLNYNLIHALLPAPDGLRMSDPPIYWIADSLIYSEGSMVTVDLYLGTSSLPVPQLYGFAFDVTYPSGMVESGTESLSFPPSWLAVPGSSSLNFSRTNSSDAHGAVVRTDHLNASGYGKIATLQFQIPVAASSSTILLDITNFMAVKADGDTLNFSSVPFTILVDNNVSVSELGSNNTSLQIFPNPYIGSTSIIGIVEEAGNLKIDVLNAFGQSVEVLTDGHQPAGRFEFTFSAASKGLSGGVYFVRVSLNGNTTMRRIVEMK